MYNPYQPFVNLINSNVALFNRFANSNDVTRLVQESVNRAFAIQQESITKATTTGAFEELTKGLANNIARFSQEYVNGLSQSVSGLSESMAQTQNMLSRQVEQGARQLAKMTDEATDATDEAAQEGLRLAKGASDRNERNQRNAKH